jgi:MFS family permease
MRAALARFTPAARRFLAGTVLLELSHAFLWALENLYVRSLGYGEGDVGLVLTAGAVGTVAATLPSASIYEKLGPRRSLTLAAAGAALSMIGLTTASSLPALFIWAALQGAAFTLHRVVAAPFLVSVSEPSMRSRLFGAEMATHTVASTIGLAVAGLAAGGLERVWLPETSALRVALIFGGLLSLSSVVPYRRLPDTTGMEKHTDDTRGVFTILAPRHWGLWWRLAVPNLLVGLGAGLTIPFINLYFTDRFGLPKAWLGVVMASSQVAMTFGVLIQPRLVDRVGLLKATLISEALSLPFFLILALTGHMGTALVAYIFRAALMNLSHPVWRQLIMELTPPVWRPAVNGVAMLAWNLGWGLSNHLGGTLIEHSSGWAWDGADGYVVPMFGTMLLYVLAILFEAVFFWKHRHMGCRPAVVTDPPAGPETRSSPPPDPATDSPTVEPQGVPSGTSQPEPPESEAGSPPDSPSAAR